MKYTLRYTLDPEINEKHYIDCIGSILLDKLNANEFTIGLEHLDKYGEPTAPHIHIHFDSDDTMGAIRNRLVRYWKNNDETRSGNALYSLKNIDKECKDFNRFYSYPLKQNGKQFDSIMTKLPDDFDLDKMREFAYQEWCRNIEHHKKMRERAETKQTTYDKLEIDLDEKNLTDTTQIKIAVIEFYKKNKLSANFKTMNGYVNTYRLIKGLMSIEEALTYMN